MPFAYTRLLLVTVAWGALAFGAVYEWAYQPLAAAMIALGLWGLFASAEPGRCANRHLAFGLTLLVAAIVVQLIPLSTQMVLAISPNADTFLRQYDLSYAAQIARNETVTHALSIEPERTRVGLLLLIALSVFLLGLARVLDGTHLRNLLPGMIILGVIVAMIGIIQKPLFAGSIYGFWTPRAGAVLYSPTGGPFGPFVNRNHFAGWMLMALPITVGYFLAVLAKSAPGRNRGWRARVEWLSSRHANKLVLIGFGIVVMTLSLVMTLSRSGIACLLISLVISASVVARNWDSRSKRVLVFSFLAIVIVVSVAWTGTAAIVDRFQNIGKANDLQFRLSAWMDAASIIRAFPLTGTGLNTYGIATLSYQTFLSDTHHFAEAHNDYLQFLAEGGLLLMLPALVLIGLFVREVRNRFRDNLDDSTGYWVRVGAVTGILAVSLQEMVEFSLQLPGNAALFVLLCAIAVRRSTGRGRMPPAIGAV